MCCSVWEEICFASWQEPTVWWTYWQPSSITSSGDIYWWVICTVMTTCSWAFREERGMRKFNDHYDHLPNSVLVPLLMPNSPDRWGMNSTRLLKVCCSIWHQDVSSRSFKSCKLRGRASMDRTVCPAHPTDAWLDRDLGNLEAKSTPHSFCFVAPATREYCLHEMVYIVCNNA